MEIFASWLAVLGGGVMECVRIGVVEWRGEETANADFGVRNAE